MIVIKNVGLELGVSTLKEIEDAYSKVASFYNSTYPKKNIIFGTEDSLIDEDLNLVYTGEKIPKYIPDFLNEQLKILKLYIDKRKVQNE